MSDQPSYGGCTPTQVSRPERVYDMTSEQVFDEVYWCGEDMHDAIDAILPSAGGDSDSGYLDRLVADDPNYNHHRSHSIESIASSRTSRRHLRVQSDEMTPRPGTKGSLSPQDLSVARVRRLTFTNSQLPSTWRYCNSNSMGYQSREDLPDVYRDVSSNIGPHVRHPRRLNPYFTFLAVIKTQLPFGIIVPVVFISIFLLTFAYSGVKVCGVSLCSCSYGESALFLLTFGLLQDTVCAILFSSITTACIGHMKEAKATTAARAKMLKELEHIDSLDSSIKVIDDHTPRSVVLPTAADTIDATSTAYGPYMLRPLYMYLKTPQTWAVAFFCLLLSLVIRGLSSHYDINPSIFFLLIGISKCLPLILYALVSGCLLAAIPSCITLIVPLCYSIIIINISNNTTTHYFTIYWPLFVLVMDRLLLQSVAMTIHPSVSSGVCIIITSCLGFFSQITLFGVGVSIDIESHPGIVVPYALQFFILELLLNTILLSRCGGKIYKLFKCYCMRDKRFKHENIGAFNGVSRHSVSLICLGNIAALTRLPTLLISSLFIITAMYFKKWPSMTEGVLCDGRTTNKWSWGSYGLLLSVCICVGIITVIIRKLRTASLVPLCVYGIGWSMLIGIYYMSIVPFSVVFKPDFG